MAVDMEPHSLAHQDTQAKDAGLFRSTLIITFFSSLNILAGFALQVVLAAKFGAEWEMDAYLAASTIPNLLTGVLLGSLRITFVPVFIEYEVRQDVAEAWKVASSFLNIASVVLGSIAVLGALCATWWVRLTVPGFAVGTDAFKLTVELFRILIPSVVFNGLGGLLASIYYSRHRFLLPAVAPLVNSLVILGGTAALSPKLGIRGLALSSLLGSITQLLLLIPIMLTKGRYRFIWDHKHPGVAQIVKLMVPWIAGAVIYKANPLLDRFIASSLLEGSISHLGYALKLTTVTVTLATAGISTTFFPLMSRYAATRNLQGLRKTVSLGIQTILLIVMPIMAGIVVLRVPVIRLFLQRGKFTDLDTTATGLAWVCYLGALLGLSVGNISSFVFYALQDTRTPVLAGIAGMMVNVIVVFVLKDYFSYLAPALAYSLAVPLNISLQLLVLRKRLRGVDGKSILVAWLKITVATLIMGGMISLFENRIDARWGIVAQSLSTLAVVSSGVFTYALCAWLLKIKVFRYILARVTGRAYAKFAGDI